MLHYIKLIYFNVVQSGCTVKRLQHAGSDHISFQAANYGGKMDNKDQSWLSFIQKGGYGIRSKENSSFEVCRGKATIAVISVSHDEEKDIKTYNLAKSENSSPAYQFIRSEKTFSCIDTETNQTLFTWQRLSNGFGELFTGCKWQCEDLVMSQNIVRSLVMWLPRISWFIPTKYSITRGEECCGIVSGAIFTLSNGKTVTVNNQENALKIAAAAIILAEDEIG